LPHHMLYGAVSARQVGETCAFGGLVVSGLGRLRSCATSG
jgi:hypothetical protein